MHNLIIASNPFTKFRGLFARPEGTFILLERCRDIHTYTMRRPIDVVFVDDDFKVVDTYFGLRPYKRVRCKNAKHTIECFSKDIKWISVGEKIIPKLVYASKKNISGARDNKKEPFLKIQENKGDEYEGMSSL